MLQCWLAGFTDTGLKSGKLWTTDLVRQKQWRTVPDGVGHERDFYRLDGGPKPLEFEVRFAAAESAIAPILRGLDLEIRVPTEDELDALIEWMALQRVRVPAFRRRIRTAADGCVPSRLLPSPNTGWYLSQGFGNAERISSGLRKRKWTTWLSKSGSFIGSDNPVAIEGTPGVKPTLVNAHLIVFPVSRHVLLFSTEAPGPAGPVSRTFIARMNTLIMLHAESQLYSAVKDFCFLDESARYQTDWKLFSEEKIVAGFHEAAGWKSPVSIRAVLLEEEQAGGSHRQRNAGSIDFLIAAGARGGRVEMNLDSADLAVRATAGVNLLTQTDGRSFDGDRLLIYIVQLDQTRLCGSIFKMQRSGFLNVRAKFVPRLGFRENRVA